MSIHPYRGPRRRLLLAFDIGTAFSHVSYAVLEPGRVPELKTVMRYPRQGPAMPIQTVVYYGATGKACMGVGEAPVEESGGGRPWKVERFKLLLFPASTATDGIPHPTLPPSKTIVDIYADFYPYLLQCACTHIRMTHVDGNHLWESLRNDIAFILSHPRGWGEAQHDVMRKAVVRGGLVPDTPEGRARIAFVAEGEASLHYQALAWGFFSEETKTCRNFMVIDAGRMTVDFATYATSNGSSATNMKELAQPICIFEGKEVVRERITRHLRGKLRKSPFGAQEYLEEIVRQFRRVDMREYRGFSELSVKFSNDKSLRDKRVGIRDGRMKLANNELRGLFDPSVEAILRAIKQQQAAAGERIGTYLLIGGFSESEYLYNQLRSFLGSSGFHLSRPNLPSKAVAEGAILYYLSLTNFDPAGSTSTFEVPYVSRTVSSTQDHRSYHQTPEAGFKDTSPMVESARSSSPQVELPEDHSTSAVSSPPPLDSPEVSSSERPAGFLSVAHRQEDSQSSDGSTASMGTARSNGSLTAEAAWIPTTSSTSDLSASEQTRHPDSSNIEHEARMRAMTERAEDRLQTQVEVMAAALPPHLYLTPSFGGSSSAQRARSPLGWLSSRRRDTVPMNPGVETRGIAGPSTMIPTPANEPTPEPYGQTPSLLRPLDKDRHRSSIQLAKPRRGPLTLDPLGRPLSDFEHHDWRLYSGLQTGSEYFHHSDLRVVTNLDLRAVDVLDRVREFLDEDGEGKRELPPEGWEMWLRAPRYGNSEKMRWRFERVWVHHGTRMVSFKYPDTRMEDSETDKSRSADIERIYWSYVEAHAAHVSLSRDVASEAKALLDLHTLDSIGRVAGSQSSALSMEECQSLKQFLDDLDAPNLAEYPILYTRKLAKIMLKIIASRPETTSTTPSYPSGCDPPSLLLTMMPHETERRAVDRPDIRVLEVVVFAGVALPLFLYFLNAHC